MTTSKRTTRKASAVKAETAPVNAPLFAPHVMALANAAQAINAATDECAKRTYTTRDPAILAEIDNAAIDNVAVAQLKMSATQRMAQVLLRGVACGFDAETLQKRGRAAFYRAARILAGYECTVDEALQATAKGGAAELDATAKTMVRTAGQNMWRASTDAGAIELKAALECAKANGASEAALEEIKAKPQGAFYAPKDESKAQAGAAGGKKKAANNGTEKDKVAPAQASAILAPIAADCNALLANYQPVLQWVARFNKANAGLSRKELGDDFAKKEEAFRKAAHAFLVEINTLMADEA